MGYLAKLNVFNQSWEVARADIVYHRDIDYRSGKPISELMGGYMHLTIPSSERDGILAQWMLHKDEATRCELTEGSLDFYKDAFDNPIAFNYEFQDAFLMYYWEGFSSESEMPMLLHIVISPAIQRFRGQLHVKLWHVSPLPSKEVPVPQQATEVEVAAKVIKVEGPYNDADELLEYAELGEAYYYYATLNVNTDKVTPNQVQWAVGYDGENHQTQYHLFSGKEAQNNKIRISISIGNTDDIQKKIEDHFRIHAYIGDTPDTTKYCQVSVGTLYETVFCGTKQWGKLQADIGTQNKRLTEQALDAKLDPIGKANVDILKWMDKDTVKAFYEKGPLGTTAVLSNVDDIEGKVIDNFYTGRLKKLSFDAHSQQSQKLKTLPSFQEYFKTYLEVILFLCENETIEQNTSKEIVEAFEIITGEKRKDKPKFSHVAEIADYDYYGFIGDTQTIQVELDITRWKKEKGKVVDFYKVKTKMYIGDWYGADWRDINGWESKLKGNVYSLNAFFWLQHHYGCHPFETEIIYESEDKITPKQ